MNGKRNETEVNIMNAFKGLMLEYPFKKITIKMITDQAGVIRPTFYTYFQDKYELFDVILDEELFDTLEDLIAVDLYKESLTMIFTYFSKNHVFYQKAFSIEGQDSFSELLNQKFTRVFKKMINEQKLSITETAQVFTIEQISNVYSISIVTILKIWMFNYEKINRTPEELVDFYIFIASHDIYDIFQKED